MSEFRATLNAREFLGTYDVRIDLPEGAVAKVSDPETIWVDVPGMPGLILGTDKLAQSNATVPPCDLRFPFRWIPHTMRSHVELPDGFVAVCDESDEPGALVVRYIRAGKSRLYCAAELDDRNTKQADAIVERCRSMTVHGPHIDNVSPEVWDLATITESDTAKQVNVRLQVPIGYVKQVSGRSASWNVPRAARVWPSISVTVSSNASEPPPEGVTLKAYGDDTSAARFIRLDAVTVLCQVIIRGSIESQIEQLKAVCASMTAELVK